jgi:uncharacterized protein (DUF58 family)
VEGLLDIHDHLDERQFALAIRRLADTLSYGTDPSPFLGPGIEYVQSRNYVPGDSVKSIDWRVTARTGRVHVKEYEAPKRVSVYLVVDTSASMAVTSAPVSKYAWAVRLAGGLALAALSRMSPVGLAGCGDRQDLRFPASLARQRVFTWLHRLRRFNFHEATGLGDTLRALEPMMTHRSLVFVISDLHDPHGPPVLKPLAQKHDCVVLQLRDPAERGRIGGGVFRAAEAETAESFISTGRAHWLNQQVLATDLKRARVDHLVLDTDQNFLPFLRAFLRKRDCLGRLAR